MASEDSVIFNKASDIISLALREGSCADLLQLETLTLQLSAIRVDTEAQLKLMLDAVRFLYVSGQAFRAIPIAQKARALGLETSQPKATLDALIALGICSADSGGLPDAMEAYADALSLAQGLSDPIGQGKVWLNLGVALMYSGLYREALGCFEKADVFASVEAGLAQNRPSIFSNIALCHLNLDEIRHGLIAIERAVELSPAPKNVLALLSRVLVENHYTRLLIEVNNFEGAKEHVFCHLQAVADHPRRAALASRSFLGGKSCVHGFNPEEDVRQVG